MASLGSASFIRLAGPQIDLCECRIRDVVLVPHGWHGPAAAAPGRRRHYHLNVMAGPGPARAWKITDHPDQAWIRSTWSEQAADPRLESDHG